MKRGTGPLQGNSTIMMENQPTSSTENVGGYSQLPNGGEQDEECGTGPLDHNNTLGEQDSMVAASSNKKPSKNQLSMTKFVKKVDRGDTRDRLEET